MHPAPDTFHPLLDAAPDAMIVVDRLGRVQAINAEAERWFGWAEQELLGEPLSRLIPTHGQTPTDQNGETNGGSGAVRRRGSVTSFARLRDGRAIPIELARRSLGDGSQGQSLLTLRRFAPVRSTRDTLVEDNELARATLESIGDAVLTTDTAYTITYLNPVAERLTGWPSREAMGQPLETVLQLVSEATRHPVANTAARCLEEERSIDLEDGVLLIRRDGTEIPIGDSAAPIRDRLGRTSGVVLVIQDESEKRRVGRRLSYEATHDALTGLINRREFERRLNRVVGDLADHEGEHILLFVDLDRFKAVNDTCGHAGGDELLRNLGPLLSRYLRKRDTLARVGGDEFGVLLENCPLAQARRIAENLRLALENYEFTWEGQDCSVGASIGLIPVTAESGGMAAVLKAADAACYAAKQAGGNRVHQVHVGSSTVTSIAG